MSECWKAYKATLTHLPSSSISHSDTNDLEGVYLLAPWVVEYQVHLLISIIEYQFSVNCTTLSDMAIFVLLIICLKKTLQIEDFSLSNLQKYTEYQCLFV